MAPCIYFPTGAAYRDIFLTTTFTLIKEGVVIITIRTGINGAIKFPFQELFYTGN